MTIDQKIKNLREALADLGQDTRQWSDDDLVHRVLSGGPSRLPEWADRSGPARLETLRVELAREGTDVTGLSDVELMGLELNRSWAESRRHHNAYSMLLQDQVKEHRAVRTATHRAAVADITAQAGLYLQVILRRNASPVEGVIYRAENLPETGRATPKDVKELRSAALRARFMLSGLASESAIADAGKDESIQVLDALKAELRRVQRVIGVIGKELHGEYGRTTGRMCECVGCELIREVNDRGASA